MKTLYELKITGALSRDYQSIDESMTFRHFVYCESSDDARKLITVHNSNFIRIDSIDVSPFESDDLNKALEIYQAFNPGKYPSIFCNSTITDEVRHGELRFSQYRNEGVTNVWLDITDKISIKFNSYHVPSGKFQFRYQLGVHGKNGYVMPKIEGEEKGSIEINISKDKPTDRIVKEVQSRLLDKNSEWIAEALKVQERQRERDSRHDKLLESFSDLLPDDRSKCAYLDIGKLRVESDYICIDMSRSYFSFTDEKKARKAIELMRKFKKSMKDLSS